VVVDDDAGDVLREAAPLGRDAVERQSGWSMRYAAIASCTPAGEQVPKATVDRGLAEWKFGGEAAGLSIGPARLPRIVPPTGRGVCNLSTNGSWITYDCANDVLAYHDRNTARRGFPCPSRSEGMSECPSENKPRYINHLRLALNPKDGVFLAESRTFRRVVSVSLL
jgi:hypothetical protein